MQNRIHYVGATPSWLTQALAELDLGADAAADFTVLEDKLGKDDVCNYYHYLTKLQSYVGNTFSDFKNVIEIPVNAEWVIANADLVKKARANFDSKFAKHIEGLDKPKVPALVKALTYRPTAVGSNILILSGFPNDVEYSPKMFLGECVIELNKQVLFDEYKTYQVFKEYTLNA